MRVALSGLKIVIGHFVGLRPTLLRAALSGREMPEKSIDFEHPIVTLVRMGRCPSPSRPCLRLLLPLLLLVQGCLVVPVPHQRLHAYGIEGRVVDEDGNPVPNVKVVSPAKNTRLSGTAIPKRLAVTDTSGFFSLKPAWGWHGAFLFSPMNGWDSIFPMFAYTLRKRELQHGNNLCFIANGFPEQMTTLDYWDSRHSRASRLEDNYITSKEFMLHHRVTPNYLATVTSYKELDILAILLCEPVPEFLTWEMLRPVCAITDTNLIQAIISEMSVPAEMVTDFSPHATNTLSCMVFLFRDKSSNVMDETRFNAIHGHFVQHDGVVMNNYVSWRDYPPYLRNVTPDTLDARLVWRWRVLEKRHDYIRQRRADVTWSFQSKTIADLVRNILSSEHPDFIVNP